MSPFSFLIFLLVFSLYHFPHFSFFKNPFMLESFFKISAFDLFLLLTFLFHLFLLISIIPFLIFYFWVCFGIFLMAHFIKNVAYLGNFFLLPIFFQPYAITYICSTLLLLTFYLVPIKFLKHMLLLSCFSFLIFKQILSENKVNILLIV